MAARARRFVPISGSCACGHVRFALNKPPLFVHACHCFDCQRESGSAFNHHIMVESSAILLEGSELENVKVPSPSGNAHYIVRCADCKTPLWSRHGSLKSKICYVKVGTLDEAAAYPPMAHIYVRSMQPWIALDQSVPTFKTYYNRERVWPEESLRRWREAR